jgi:hypothetical protein
VRYSILESKMKKAISLLLVMSLVSCFTQADQHFHRLIGFPPNEDVKELNVYANELGIDASYWISFKCHDSTVKKIVNQLRLKERKNVHRGMFGGLNSEPTKWWDTSFVFQAKPFERIDEDARLFWYLWYNKNNNMAYLLTGDY